MGSMHFGDLFVFVRNGLPIKQDKISGGFPISRIETISNQEVDPNRVGFAGLKNGKHDEWLLEPGDILFSHINSLEHLGKCAIYRGVPQKLIHGMNLLCLRTERTIADPLFVTYLIRSPYFRRRLKRIINPSVNQVSVSVGNLKRLDVEIPTLPEQKRIAAILDKADALRRKRRDAIAKLDTLLWAAFSDLFGDLQAEARRWPSERLGSVLVLPLRNGLSPSNSGRIHGRVLTLSAITRGAFDQEAVKEACFTEVLPSNRLVSSEDFLICRGNGNIELVGRACFPIRSLNDTVFPDTMIAARVDTERILPAFLERLWATPLVCKQIRRAARTTNGTYKVNQGTLEAIELIVPPIELQRMFARQAEAVRRVESVHSASEEKLERLFCRLQTDAFSAPQLAMAKESPGQQCLTLDF